MAKKYWIFTAVGVIVLVGVLAAAPKLKTAYERSNLQPEVEFSTALEHMGTLESFAYAIHSTFQVQNREELMSDVTGEREDGKVHIQGEMVKTPIDIYYIDGMIYNYDETAEKWMVIESNTGSAAELYINELNPLIYIDFRENGMKAEYDFGELEGDECLLVSGQPMMRSELLDSIWQDFSCTLWIDYENHLVKQVSLQAVNRNNPQTKLDITATFSQFDQKMNLEPPDLTQKKSADS